MSLSHLTKPIYHFSLDSPDRRCIVLIIRTGNDGVVRGRISLPQWYELPETWDGPHDAASAVRLAGDYAGAYGYQGVAVDIESSQLWDPAWGELSVAIAA